MTLSLDRLSVVIPTLNERDALPSLLDDLSQELRPLEVIVSDGGSRDGTAEMARNRGVTIVSGHPGRGAQLRRGAARAAGEWYAFIHADCRLKPQALSVLADFLETATPFQFAHFRLRFDHGGVPFRVIEAGQRIRERVLGMPYGDQALIVSRKHYDHAGGYPTWPIMEDVGLVDRLTATGRRIVLPAAITTSGRRYQRSGPLRGWMRNTSLISAFRLGVPPERLARWYRPEQAHGSLSSAEHRAHRSSAALIVFARNPVPGQVKTRLAADLGEDRATAIYRYLGRATLDGVRGGPWTTTVHVDPPDPHALEAVHSWLGDGVRYEGQVTGDLGARMKAALTAALEESDMACVIGTDLPGLDAGVVRAAFRALEDHDLVLGPATDGGYYLIGVKEGHADLFRDIPWSSPLVMRTTQDRARSLGLRVATMEVRTDVDTVDDMPAELMAEF